MLKSLTKEQLDEAYQVVKQSPYCVRTPLLKNVENLGLFDLKSDVNIHLKLENVQTSGIGR